MTFGRIKLYIDNYGYTYFIYIYIYIYIYVYIARTAHIFCADALVSLFFPVHLVYSNFVSFLQ